MRNVLTQVFIAAAVSGVCSAGVMQELSGSGFYPNKIMPAGLSAPAPSPVITAPELKGENAGEFCFEAYLTVTGMEEVTGIKIPQTFCVSGVRLARLGDGSLTMAARSDFPGIGEGRAEYVYENGVPKYAQGEVFYKEAADWRDKFNASIKLLAPVYPNGNLVPGAAVRPVVTTGYLPRFHTEWYLTPVTYCKTKPKPSFITE